MTVVITRVSFEFVLTHFADERVSRYQEREWPRRRATWRGSSIKEARHVSLRRVLFEFFFDPFSESSLADSLIYISSSYCSYY